MRETIRDPHKGWKLMTMILAAAVLVLSLASLFISDIISLSFGALLLGALMCTASGILALSKGRKVLGYFCAVLAGGFLVLFIIGLIWLIW